MLTLSLLACLATLTAPLQAQEAPPQKEFPSVKEGYGGFLASQSRRWKSRRDVRKVLSESGGRPLLDAYEGTWLWMSRQTPEEGLIVPEAERGVGASALAALSMSGNAAGYRAGNQFKQYRVLVDALWKLQDTEKGTIGATDAPEFVLDQALAVHLLAEALFTHPVKELHESLLLAAEALIARRSPDGLWHVGGKAEAPVDALATGMAAYALYTAHDSGAGVAAPVFQAIADWSAVAKPSDAGESERARDLVAILCARIFAYEGLENEGREQGLKGDARIKELLESIDSALPTAGDEPSDGQAANNDFTYLASVALYQADNRRWNRLYQWISAQAIADANPDKRENTGFAAGANGRLPAGAITTSALRLLQIQSAVREPALSCFSH